VVECRCGQDRAFAGDAQGQRGWEPVVLLGEWSIAPAMLAFVTFSLAGAVVQYPDSYPLTAINFVFDMKGVCDIIRIHNR
jgi:hypothetical protein